MADKEYKTFGEFYPYYLNEHRKLGTRVTHFVGTSLFFILAITAIIQINGFILLAGVVCAYFFAWIGHFFIEKNKPATFKYPWMSLKGDFKLYFEILMGKQKFKGN
ncbi:MAG: Mpo1-like protein [Bacteroidia bacterium]